MPSAAERRAAALAKSATLGVLTALAVAAAMVENSFPTPLPWIRLGLANAVSLLVLLSYGALEAIGLTLARVFMAALLTGNILAPTFYLSLGGGLVGTVVMAVLNRARIFSPIGISVGGSFAHTLTQFGILFILLSGREQVLAAASPFLLLALPAGAAVGWIVAVTAERLRGALPGA